MAQTELSGGCPVGCRAPSDEPPAVSCGHVAPWPVPNPERPVVLGNALGQLWADTASVGSQRGSSAMTPLVVVAR